MPFEAKKEKVKNNGEKYKDYKDYKTKNMYFDESNEYQAQCLSILKLCGHKQAKFISLLVHDYLVRNGLIINQLDKKRIGLMINMLEEQCNTGFRPTPFIAGYNPNMVIPPVIPTPEKKEKLTDIEENTEDEFMDEDAKEEMNEALSFWGS